jgi:CRP/FNR family transcriptional regulator, cyclic AMP receptor protein
MNGIAALTVRSDWNHTSDRDWADVLARLPLFDGIGRRDLRRIAGESEFAEFAPGETVVATRAPSDYFYVVLSGKAEAIARPASRTLELGDYFGEMGMLDGEPRSASIVATSDLHVMRLPRRAFNAALQRHPTIARRFLTELGTRVRTLEHQAAAR